jgi:magnesium transporter
MVCVWQTSQMPSYTLSPSANDSADVLDVNTTLFMPLSFLAGFFGMNFFQATVAFEAWTGRVAFGLMIAAMILLPLAMFLWIRRRAWM